MKSLTTAILNINQNFSWAGDFYFSNINTNYNLFNQGGYQIQYWGEPYENRSIWFSICDNSLGYEVCYQYYGNNFPVQANTWFNLAVSVDSGNVKIYILMA